MRVLPVCAALALFFATSSFAKEPPGPVPAPKAVAKAAACAPASNLKDLEWNNVKALIETGGNMWQDRATSRASYEIPKNGGVSSLYAGSLWMGGRSSDKQLKLAALTFRNSGNDYWTGPLSTDQQAEIPAAECTKWDKFFVTYRQDALLHQQYFDCLENGTAAEKFPNGYAMPPYFSDYQANGNLALFQDHQLLPFYDRNGNTFYEPELGDYPGYDILKQINCKERDSDDLVPLYGDINYSWIFNDKGNVHSESGGQPIGMEIRAQAFAYTTNDEVNNMTFYNYVLINQGSQQLHDTW
ncbi:MAG: T9SS C-terminal target domain-containing protein, partial [Flavobacteriales bacterium]|nr:T9SS C-terminal target domain-containing protein [Flavobacteriales bacterium]